MSFRARDLGRRLTAPGARREPRGNRRRSRRPPPARGRECGNGATRRQGGHRPPASVRKQPRKASFHPISRALPTIGAEAAGSSAIATAGPANPGQQRSACGQTAGHTRSFRSKSDQRIHASRPPRRHPRRHRRNRGQNYHGRQEAPPIAGLDVVQEAADRAGERIGARDSGGDAERQQETGFAEHEGDDAAGRGAEGQPNPELLVRRLTAWAMTP